MRLQGISLRQIGWGYSERKCHGCDCRRFAYVFFKGTGKENKVKHTNAKFGWGTRTGKELSELNPKLELIKESSFWDEMKKYTLVGKIGSVLVKDLNNRLAVYRWQGR